VVEGQGPPNSQSLGVFSCTFCRTRLYGHGWRRRYFITGDLASLRLWIHRKLCPCCRKTYTLLPVWVHAFKLFSLETIHRLLAYRIEKGHFNTIPGVSGYLQRRWWKRYSDRTAFLTRSQMTKSILIATIPGSNRFSFRSSSQKGFNDLTSGFYHLYSVEHSKP